MRFNIITTASLKNIYVKTSKEIYEILRTLQIPVQTSGRTAEYLTFFIEKQGQIPYVETLSVNKKDIKRGYKIDYYGKRTFDLNLFCSEDEFLRMVENNIFYSPYGMVKGLNELRNWKKVKFEDIGKESLWNEYFNWRLKKNPQEYKLLGRLKVSLRKL